MLFKGLLLAIFLDYVRPGAFIPAFTATKIGTIIPLAVFVLTIFQKGPTSLSMVMGHANTKWLMYFLFLLLVSVLLADVTFYSYQVFSTIVGFLLWYFMVSSLITNLREMKAFFLVLIYSHVLLIILNPDVVLNPAVRSYVLGSPYLGDGNDFSLSLCIVIPMCIYLFNESKGTVAKSIYGVTLIVLILSVIGTQSRGATLALAGIFLYLWWAGRMKAKGLLLISILSCIILFYAPSAYFERMDTIRNYEEEGSAQARIVSWRQATKMAIKYPITGVGTGHFPTALGTEFKPPEFNDWQTAHSMYFLILGELGIPGIIFLLGIIIWNFNKNSKLLKQARGSPGDSDASYASMFVMLNASLIGFSIAAAFLSVAYYPHLYILAGVFAGAHFTYLHRVKEKSDTLIEENNSNYKENIVN